MPIVVSLAVSLLTISAAAAQPSHIHDSGRLENPNGGITFEQIFDQSLMPKTIRAVRWLQSGPFYTALVPAENGKYNELVKFNAANGEREVLLGVENLVLDNGTDTLAVDDYEISSDGTRVLLASGQESIWRRSRRAHYHVMDIENEEITRISPEGEKVRAASLSPDAQKVAYVLENNLYWVDIDGDSTYQVTRDGKDNHIINGVSDWVYEEEFSFAKAWFWSPNSKRIAFYRFDESRVKEFTIRKWGKLYPEKISYKYPKAGEQNSIVKIGVYDLDTEETSRVDVGPEDDQYIVRVNWAWNSDELAIRRMNRLQNRQDLLLADLKTGNTDTLKTEVSDTWIDENDALTFLDGNRFI